MPQKVNRREIIKRLVEIPDKNKREFWRKEMSILKKLEERYSLDFLSIVSFPEKFDSLAYICSEALKEKMDLKWKNFNFKVDFSKYTSYDVGEKYGEDYSSKNKKFKSIKNFLENG